MSQSPISCELHDYIEIACMHRYQIKIKLKGGQAVTGVAVDTSITSEKREYLIVENGQKQSIELNQIAKIETLSPGAVFKEITFLTLQ
jgi:Rho-binding antiterminator